MPTDDQAAAALGGRDYGATLWEPSERVVRGARITGYQAWLRDSRGADLHGYDELWRWSVARPDEFWASVWDYFGVLGRRGDGPVLSGGPMPDVSWFGGTTLNYAGNALRTARTEPDKTAVIFRSESGRSGTLSFGQLAAEVARVRAGLRALGVTRGDRVAAYAPNIPEALIGLLAAASLGAIWSSCSPDFGPRSVIDRLAQISPKVLIAVDGYPYNGRWFDRRRQVADVVAELPGLEAVIMVDYAALSSAAGVDADAGAGAGELGVRRLRWDALPGEAAATAAGEFEEVPFEHPLWVLYSSGTTGLPKPIVHGHGGIVLEHLKAMALHQDLGPADVFFWYTTTGWMMWNYLAGGLLVGAAVVLYDGSATHPGTDALWRLAAETGVTYFGTGAPYLLACMKAGLRPRGDHDLSRLRGVGSTGSPLPPEGFRWVYDAVARDGKGGEGGEMKDLILGSYSGGTDLCTGFVGPCPLLPVRAGVISGRCLGAAVEAYDASGRPVIGEVGELVITQPMPSMPVGFWNDPGGKRYRESYFADYPGVWRHGDWVAFLPDGGCVIYGRSDATLNRGGVRMGTSEFYRIVEALPEIADSLVVDTGQLGREGRLLLYVVLAAGHELDDELTGRIRSGLRAGLSPRHVPDEIHQVPGIPRTLSGKKLEVPVRKILLGTPVADAADPDALANPEVLESFVPGTRREPSGGQRERAKGAQRERAKGRGSRPRGVSVSEPKGRSVSEPKGRAAVWTDEGGREERAPERGGKTAGQSAPEASEQGKGAPEASEQKGRNFGEEGGRLTYGSYLRLPELLAQQVPQVIPPAHDELLFITVHQAYELWFKQLLHELTTARDAMRPGQAWRARQLLQRAHVIERLLVSQIDVLETMTPQDFLEFRAALAPASGFQSVQFRELEFLSGAKDPRFVTRFRALTDAERDRLARRLAEPTLWDAYLGLLRSRGLPADGDDEVLTSLVAIARDRARHDDLWQLAEDLLTHDELSGLWRARHVQMVERQIGTKSGTGGSTGAPYLQKRVPLRYYPLLWELRDWL